jgi:hypothetical protein
LRGRFSNIVIGGSNGWSVEVWHVSGSGDHSQPIAATHERLEVAFCLLALRTVGIEAVVE